MKRISLILNVILIIAVGILYFLHFSNGTSGAQTKEAQASTSEKIIPGDLQIAYVRLDSLLTKMDMYTDLTEKLTQKQKKLETSFASQYQMFEKEVSDFQNKVNKGLVTRREAQDLEAGLGNKQLELENQRNSYLAELQEEGIVSQNKVINYIMDYLKEYNSDNRYQYIFSYSFGGGLLYVPDAMDITSEVLTGINLKYNKESSSEK